MPIRHVLAAVAVMVIWGANFVVIQKGLNGVPPLTFVALRFAVVLLALPFVPRPRAPLRHVLLLGLAMSLGQFAFLYAALAAGMPPGLASLVLQLQAVLTLALAAAVLGERPLPLQLLGVALGLLGLVIVGTGRGGHVGLPGLLLTVGAALSWAVGNVLVRRLGLAGGLGLTVWSGLVVPLPLLALSCLIDGPAVVGHALAHLTWTNWLATTYTAVLASLVGYGVWTRLLTQHPASSVAPFTLLVPLAGLSTAWLVNGERPTALLVIGGLVLLAGVALVTLGPRLLARRGAGSLRTE